MVLGNVAVVGRRLPEIWSLEIFHSPISVPYEIFAELRGIRLQSDLGCCPRNKLGLMPLFPFPLRLAVGQGGAENMIIGCLACGLPTAIVPGFE